MTRRVAITGASGGGKSTLLSELERRGYSVQPEVGRQIVAEQIASGRNALPSKDPIAFRDLLFARSIEAYDRWTDSERGITFFDRTFIEAIAYSSLIGAEVPELMMEQANQRRFEQTVFVCPPWPEIYATDPERQHGFDFALKDYEANVTAYAAQGYELVELPKSRVETRADFLLGAIRG
ncbi:hypothetical protein E1162_07075 [Rhodobacteraceae bacterium RKSG542]|uniref:AAA family ATPase n=1 Tax=Pseudovibrio flavus TaxID=2529854 RepID=UPI0012BD40C1|nr:AAA family ATPase [Pseudovibrio flavus]MTI16999.1 hypothetical protein [Pseudovibrio flavus]